MYKFDIKLKDELHTFEDGWSVTLDKNELVNELKNDLTERFDGLELQVHALQHYNGELKIENEYKKYLISKMEGLPHHEPVNDPDRPWVEFDVGWIMKLDFVDFDFIVSDYKLERKIERLLNHSMAANFCGPCVIHNGVLKKQDGRVDPPAFYELLRSTVQPYVFRHQPHLHEIKSKSYK